MALGLKALGDDEINSTSAVVLGTGNNSVSSGKAWLIKNIRFVNKDTTDSAVVNVYLRHTTGGTDRSISETIVMPPGTMFVYDVELTIEYGDSVRAKAVKVSNGTAILVDFYLSGVERDAA